MEQAQERERERTKEKDKQMNAASMLGPHTHTNRVTCPGVGL